MHAISRAWLLVSCKKSHTTLVIQKLGSIHDLPEDIGIDKVNKPMKIFGHLFYVQLAEVSGTKL